MRIYVASLSDYNAGRLHGVHIDLPTDEDEVWEKIRKMLRESPEAKAGYGPAEEFAIHDYEGFHSYRIHEFESISSVVKIANFLDQFGEAGAAWLANDSTNLEQDDLEEAFNESYRGVHKDAHDYAFDYISSVGEYRGIPFEIFDENYPIFDWDNIADDLMQNTWTISGDEGIHVFSMY